VEDISLRWLRLILYFFTFISLLALLTNLFSDIIPIISFLQGDNLTLASLTLVIFVIGYFGIKQKAIDIPNEKIEPKIKSSYQKSGFKIAEQQQYIQRLLQLMEEEKCYLQSRLSLKDLADKLDLSENNLSQLINEGMQKTFYDFVNEYRVEEVKRKILNPKNAHLTLLGIAFESGFNSKSSFNLIFKKFTGQTPTQFKKENAH
jgi:AraC-like DNA-binding protein